MEKVSQGIIDYIERHDCFYILGHREPDGDCVGSQLALASFLKRLGKRAHVLSSGPFTRSEILPYEHKFRNQAPPLPDYERAAAIVLDCSSLSRIGQIGETMPQMPVAFIDHHASTEESGEWDYMDRSAPAVTAMIWLLMEAMQQKATKEEADLLFFGLATDTGFFRHLDEKSASVLSIASAMVEAGASPKRIYQEIHGGKTLFSRKLLGEILMHIEPYYGGRLLVSYMTLDDQQRYGMASRDSDLLYQLIMGIAGCEACFVVKQEAENQCTVGFRSRERIDVSAIAARYGGGGHRLASGLSMQGSVDTVLATLIQAFADQFPEED